MVAKLVSRIWVWSVAVTAGLLCGVGVVHFALAACAIQCNEGCCWKFEAECFSARDTTAWPGVTEAGSTWAANGGGTWTPSSTTIADHLAHCAKECPSKTFSRAMTGASWQTTTCNGRDYGDYEIPLAFCGSGS